MAEVTRGVIANLHHLSPDDFRFSLIVDSGERDDLRAIMPAHCDLLPLDTAALPARRREFGLVGTAVAKRVLNFQADTAGYGLTLPDATGTLRAAGVDVVHGLLQFSIDSDLPLVYHPHDLQHLHLPQFFSDSDLVQREVVYQYFCSVAACVPVASHWIAEDLAWQYRVPSEKVAVIPFGAPATDRNPPTPEEVRTLCDRWRIQPGGFLLYPAAGWEHKNHIRLVEAAAWLRTQGHEPPLLLFTGALRPFSLRVLERAAELNVTDRVRWAGYIAQRDLVVLYQLARGAVVPTKFEAASAPVWEAFTSGCPVACSNVTSLPAQTDGGALLFDPDNPAQIGTALWKLWSEPALRAQLAARGRDVVARHTWESVVRRFGVLYRKAAGQVIGEADEALLSDGPTI